MNEDLISIIIPVYNAENYLDACINSVINQSYENIEIILINDGSTDNSLDICKTYSFDKRIKIISKKNEGLSKTRQLGIESSAGLYFCTIDADDTIEEKYIEKLYYKIIEENSDISVCETNIYHEDRIQLDKIDTKITKQITKTYIENNYYTLTKKYYMSDSWNKLYRKKFVQNTKIKFSLPKNYKGNDLLFNHQLLLHSPKIAVVNEPLYNYYIREGTLSRKGSKNYYQGFIHITNRIIDEMNKLEYSKVINKEISKKYISLMYFSLIEIYNTRKNDKDCKENFKKLLTANENFIKNQQRIELYPLRMKKITYILTTFILKRGNSQMLYWFFKLRFLIN